MPFADPTGCRCFPFLEEIIRHTLDKINPSKLICENLQPGENGLRIQNRRLDLNKYEKIHVIGVGKASAALWEGLDHVLGPRIAGGIIVSLEKHAFTHRRVAFYPGAHPIPNTQSLEAGSAVVRYTRGNIGPNDLVFFLVSGGGSAMMAQPAEGITLEDKIAINRLMLDSGAEVTETNCVRKQMSTLKGGKMARMVSPAGVISLVLSDIVDSPLGDVGSGPSIPDSSTKTDALRILQKYGVFNGLREEVKNFFLRAEPSSTSLQTAIHNREMAHFLLGDNLTALEAAKNFAVEKGIRAHILTSRDKGEASEAAKIYAAVVKEAIHSGNPFKPPVLLISGGEVTVTLRRGANDGRETGKGGRNQEWVLHMLKELKGVNHPFFIASMGTDGIDGNTDAAGAWIDLNTYDKVKKQGLDWREYLVNHNSYEFFGAVDQSIKTGPTGTNVMDLRLLYIA